MKLFLLTRLGYLPPEEYNGAVVCAEDAAAALRLHPGVRGWSWVEDDTLVQVEELGPAHPEVLRGVVLSSVEP